MEEILNKYPLLKNQNVPRETFIDFEEFIIMLQKKNEEINIIGKNTGKIRGENKCQNGKTY